MQLQFPEQEFSFRNKTSEIQHHCLVAGERIGTQRGIIPVEEASVGDVTNFGKILQCSSNSKPARRITTKSGYQILCAVDHVIGMSDGNFCAADASTGQNIRLHPPLLAIKIIHTNGRDLPERGALWT